MQDNDKLIALVEQAACSINMIDSEDVSESEVLQSTLEEINQCLSQIESGPAKLLEQARGAGSELEALVRTMLKKDIADVNSYLETLSDAMANLQTLTEEIKGSRDHADKVVEEARSSESEEVQTQQTSIAEEDVPLVLDFITESYEHIESAEAGLLALEAQPGDTEVLNQVFRGFHTIKGMAGFLNLSDIGSLAHSAENLLDLARKGELCLTGNNLDLILSGIDMLKSMLAQLTEAVNAGDPVPAPESLPGLLAGLKQAVNSPSQDTSQNVPDTKPKTNSVEKVVETGTDSVAPQVHMETSPDSGMGVSGREKGKETSLEEKIRVSTTRLDSLVNMAGELAIAQLMVAEETQRKLSNDHTLNQKIAHQGKIVRELQELSMSMRMVPIAGVFQKMARLVRDLSHKAGKDIRFVTQGEDTELDRNIVDKIADPLIHMIRNSIDHGIEAPEDRTQRGKPAKGTIELRAFHQAGNIVIEIEDDGKGLNQESILKKAIDNGIVASGQDLTSDEIYRLIFHAGLSTAQKITDVSGRGVGMDVVKRNIESLRGKIDIRSVPGQGTTFAIRMPLTLAMIDGQIVTVGSERYIIPIHSIVSTFKPERTQLSTVQDRGEMVMARGRLLPLVRLSRLFGHRSNTEDPTEALLVIVEDGGKQCCLHVDELLGQQQVVIKSLGDVLGKVTGISGGAIMGDGKISLILDVPGLMAVTGCQGGMHHD
jgi:two-component system chemotaxis sensor kinase CheA